MPYLASLINRQHKAIFGYKTLKNEETSSSTDMSETKLFEIKAHLGTVGSNSY